MPLASYTYLESLHPDAKLSDAQRQTLIDWAHAQMDQLKAQYPPDSLVMRRRTRLRGNNQRVATRALFEQHHPGLEKVLTFL